MRNWRKVIIIKFYIEIYIVYIIFRLNLALEFINAHIITNYYHYFIIDAKLPLVNNQKLEEIFTYLDNHKEKFNSKTDIQKIDKLILIENTGEKIDSPLPSPPTEKVQSKITLDINDLAALNRSDSSPAKLSFFGGCINNIVESIPVPKNLGSDQLRKDNFFLNKLTTGHLLLIERKACKLSLS